MCCPGPSSSVACGVKNLGNLLVPIKKTTKRCEQNRITVAQGERDGVIKPLVRDGRDALRTSNRQNGPVLSPRIRQKSQQKKTPAELGAAGAWSRRNLEGFLSPSNAPGHTTGRTRGEGPKETRKSEAACVRGSGAGAPCDSSTRSRTCAAIDT